MNTKKVLLLLAALASLMLMSFSAGRMLNLATVSKNHGLYVFYLSEPTADYEVLGEITVGLVLNDFPSDLLNSITKRAGKKYPDADAVIFLDRNMMKAEVIRFR